MTVERYDERLQRSKGPGVLCKIHFAKSSIVSACLIEE